MTPSSELPSAVSRLLEERVRSIEALEVLMVLHTGGELPRAELAARARFAPEAIDMAIEELGAAGLVVAVPPANLRYHPPDAATADSVEQLVMAYQQRRVDLLVLISAKAMKRVRRGALQTFSEAFRVRGPKKDG